MQWGHKECHSFFARRYPQLQSITNKQKQQKEYRPQALIPRCQSVIATCVSHDGASSTDCTPSSPPRRARLKPPLNLHLGVFLLLVWFLSTITTAAVASNSTDSIPNVNSKPIKLRVVPAARQAVAVHQPQEFQCTGGQPPYRWEYHIQDEAQMANWRFVIRHNKDNCLPNVTVRQISENDRVHFDPLDGRLIFDWTELNDTGIYRCFGTPTVGNQGGCVELHLLVFEPTSYMSHLRLIYGLFAIVIFIASLSAAWQLWNSSAFHRKAMARSFTQAGGSANSSYHNGNSSGHTHSSAFSPVIRLFTRGRSPSSTKPTAFTETPDSGTHSGVGGDDPARWPVLRRRLSSIEDSTVIVTVPNSNEVTANEEQVRISLEENHQKNSP